MTLDLLQVAPQVQAMAQEAGARRQTLAWRRDVAVSLMEAWDARLDELRFLVQQEQPWLVAEPLEPLRTDVPAPPLPPDVAEAIAGYAAGLEAFRQLGVPICSYVSRTGGHEVVNLLRLAACPSGPGKGSAPSCE